MSKLQRSFVSILFKHYLVSIFAVASALLSLLTLSSVYAFDYSKSPETKILVLLDTSKSVREEQFPKIMRLLAATAENDKLARLTTFVTYPNDQGARILNFRNSSEISTLLGALTSSRGKADLNLVFERVQSWSSLHEGQEKRVFWFSDGGGVKKFLASGSSLDKFKSITALTNWYIYDTSSSGRVGKLEIPFPNYFWAADKQYSEVPRISLANFDFRVVSNPVKTLENEDLDSTQIFISISGAIAILFLLNLAGAYLSSFRIKALRKTALSRSQAEKLESEDEFFFWRALPDRWSQPVSKLIDMHKPDISQRRRFILTLTLLSVLSTIWVIILENLIIAVVLSIGLLPLISTHLQRVKNKQDDKKFENELPALLLMISGGLKSGLALEQSISAYCQTNKGVASRELKRVTAEIGLGSPIEVALGNLCQRRSSEDLKWVTTAITIQRQVGGNLSEVMDSVIETIRDRNEVKREIKSLSAEGKLSAYVLIALPLGILGFLFSTRRSYVETLWQEPIGVVVLGLIGVLILIGWIWMRKIIDINL